jgi:exodeoxyribonuclease V alpha subunit
LFECLQTFRVLCAEREGPRGVDAINQRLSHFLQVALGNTQTRDLDNDFYAFRPVMVLRNDYDLGLYNGDVGIVLPNKAGALSVHFPQPDKSYHVVSCLRLPEHDTALAMTVHKAQGSEFDFVTLVLPSHPSRVLSRELLYTAATRSKRRFTLIGARSVIQHAISHTTPRQSGFKDRIAHLLTQTHELPL